MSLALYDYRLQFLVGIHIAIISLLLLLLIILGPQFQGSSNYLCALSPVVACLLTARQG